MILDAIGHIEAIGVGHYLAERGREVTVVTPMHSPLLLDAETMQKALPRAVRAGVRWRPNTAVVAIGDHEVTVADVMSYAVETLPADHVVIRTHGVAERRAVPRPRGRGARGGRESATPWSPTRRPRDLRRPPRRPRPLAATATVPHQIDRSDGGLGAATVPTRHQMGLGGGVAVRRWGWAVRLRAAVHSGGGRSAALGRRRAGARPRARRR